MIQIVAVPAFSDNYLWLAVSGTDAIAVDPGDSEAIEHVLQQRGLTLRAILITHHHPDHTGGVEALAQRHRCPVHGPDDARIPARTHTVRDLDTVRFAGPGLAFEVWAVPGHTRSHVAYVGEGAVFCGDTLFGAGCGRLFEGTPAQMLASLDRLAGLPGPTRVHCAHEYTLANLRFARTVLPEDAAILARESATVAMRTAGTATVPFEMSGELSTNVFLRCDQPALITAVERQAGVQLRSRVEVFASLRAWKDQFREAA